MTDQWMRKLARGTAVAALVFGGGAAARAADEALAFSLDLGAQGVSLDGERNARFEEYQEVPEGAVLERMSLAWVPADGPWSLRLEGRDATQSDERYDLSLARAGRFRLRARWDETPHLGSRGATALLAGSPGNLTLSQSLRAALEANPALVPEVLASTARPVAIGVDRETATAKLGFRLARGWDLEVSGGRQRREGSERIATGTYIRRQAVEPGTGAGTFYRERFEPRGLEMPEPVDYEVNRFGLAGGFHGKRGFVRLGFEGSEFRNRISTLFWDNPFEASPSVASAADRGRSARGALDLAPDNSYQRFSAAGGLHLPGHTRIDLTVARAETEQDDPFLPFTQNEALRFPGPDGVMGTADDVPGTSLGLLPAGSLDGRADTTRADLRLSTRPAAGLTLRGAYRFYEYEDESRHLVLPGYAAFGESAYRVGIGLALNGVQALFNEPGGYRRTVWSAGGAYRLGKAASLDAEYRSTTWEYDKRQVEETDEEAIEVKLQLTPRPWFAARLGWLDADRDFAGDYEIGLETSRVRAFDVWNRERSVWTAEVDFLPAGAWTFGLAFRRGEDDYPGVIPAPTTVQPANPFPSFAYGLNEVEEESLSATATYASTAWSLTGTLGRDTSDWTSLAVTKTTLANDAVQYDPANRWRREQDDAVDWGSLALEAQLVPEKVDLTVDVSYSLYEGELKTTNLATPTIGSGLAHDFPVFDSDWWSATALLDWTLRPGLQLAARYQFEPYRLTDFMWDLMQPSMQGVYQETAGAPNQVATSTVNRYLFLDSRYSDYTAHVVSVLLRLRY